MLVLTFCPPPPDPQIRVKAKSRRLKLDQVDYSFGIANTSSIVSYMGPIFSWYWHDTVLTVLCLSGNVTTLILAILK
jgi:hypothetical protein